VPATANIMNFIPSQVPTLQLHEDEAAKMGIRLFVKRLDLIHPVISGNKWFKLKYNFEKATSENKKSILTFGGAYSNHIAATAAAAKLAGIQATGIIRGEKPVVLNPVLKYAGQQEMELVFISREEYRKKNEPAFLINLNKEFHDPYIIPEGGANVFGVKGCTEILKDEENYDYIFCACGTATTLAGLILSCKNSTVQIKGISVLKGAFSLNEKVIKFLSFFDNPEYFNNWSISHEYHFGAYAKSTPALHKFIESFKKKHDIFIEPVYTGKVFFAVYDLISKKLIRNDSKILIVHTGGFRNSV
jgi:1-aminocyclopropane-1-carboxylate deaminase